MTDSISTARTGKGDMVWGILMLIWMQWPFSSAWAIGTLVGVSLIFSGISRLMLSSALSRAATGGARTAV